MLLMQKVLINILGIVQSLTEVLPIANKIHFNYFGDVISLNSYFNIKEIRAICNDIRSNFSRDIYDMNNNILKYVKNLLIRPLTKLINICIRKFSLTSKN